MSTWTYDETEQPVTEPAPEQKSRWKKPVALGAVGVLSVALAYGAGTASTQPELSAAQQALDEAEALLADTEAEVAEWESKSAALEEQGDALYARDVALGEREAALDAREAAIQQTEAEIDASKIQPGTYLVPDELTAGRYRPVNNVTGGCYMSQDRGDDIIDNLRQDEGRPVFTVQNIPGTTFYFDSDCGVVQKID